MVVLSNESSENGVICADAVRFGGGMGKYIPRHSKRTTPLSGGSSVILPNGQVCPYDVYGGKQGTNDYADDINARSNTINYLSGGSVFNPGQKGLVSPLK